MDTKPLLEKLNQNYNWLKTHEMDSMATNILDAMNTIIYLEKELETANVYVNNFKSFFIIFFFFINT